MAEVYESDAILNALSGTTDSETGAVYEEIGASPYYTQTYKIMRQIIKLLGPTMAELQPYVDDATTHSLGVRAGTLRNGDGDLVAVASEVIGLANGSINYVFVKRDGAAWDIGKTIAAWPVGEHVKIATVDLTSSPAQVLQSHITDLRGGYMYIADKAYPTVNSVVCWENEQLFYQNEMVLI